ncbi:hypothetical protein [Paenibacillus endoradicis]|uniref:hypothetical protein n=1 Tax=Paenibacillus endoradicis TaxID=2972487 RepID=UPI002158E0CE|nr:hypothetical protein [Paenibacillus endoradicis]MCR8656946.1 hypothetical protein [Paenibacillus endoradicis]
MNVFEGVDTSVIDNMFWTLIKTMGIFVLAPCILGVIVGRILRVKRRAMDFIITLFGLAGIYIWLSNYDQIYKWLS